MKLIITKFGKFMAEWLFLKKYSAAGLTCLAAALALCRLRSSFHFPADYFLHADPGKFLIYGINTTLVSRAMPLLNIFSALFDDLQGKLPLITGAALALLYWMSYELGRAKGGALTGALYLLSAAIVSISCGIGLDTEQLFYVLLILLYLNMEEAGYAGSGGLKGAAAGLALGFTMLVRSPLFLFPPLALFLRFTPAERPARLFLKKAVPFLVGAYILLLPWLRLNYFLLDKFVPFEYERAHSNIVTGVKGAVYTMEGDARALAGLKVSDSVYGWAAAEIYAHPADYALAVVRRVWHVALMFPYLFFAIFLVFILGRKRPDKFLTGLALYFILIHCFLSIEERYFYPLGYLLGFIVVSGLRTPVAAAPATGRGLSWPVRIVFAAVLFFALYAEYVVVSYPFKAGTDTLKDLTRAIGRHLDVPWLVVKKGEELLRFDNTEEGLALLKQAAVKAGSGDSSTAYILRTLTAVVPEPVPSVYRSEDNYAPMAVRLLREVELNRQKEAEAAFNDLYSLWDGQKNILRGLPYEQDRAVLKEIKRTNHTLELSLLAALRYWPKAKRMELLARLRKMVPASLQSGTAVFLSLPLRTQMDRSAFRAYLEKTPPDDYLEPLYYDDAGRKLLAAAVRQARRPGGKDLETPLGLVLSALKERAVKNGNGNGEIEDLIGEESQFSIEEVAQLRNLCLQGGDLARSKALLARRPESPVYFYLYAAAAAASGGPEEWTLAALRQAPEVFLSAAAFYGPRQARRASFLLGFALKNSAVPAEALLKFGPLFQELDRLGEALALMDAAIARVPADARLYNSRGLLFRLKGDSRRAEQDYLKALQLDPKFLEAELDLAAVYLARGKTTAAAGNLYNFASRAPSEAALETVSRNPGLVLAAAVYFSSAGRPQKAGALLDFILKAPALSLDQLRMASAAYQNMGSFEKALAVTDRALAGYPGEANLFNDRGVLLRFSGKSGPAELEFKKALQLKPAAWEPGLNLASLLGAAGRPDEARKIYERLLGRSDLPGPVRALITSELARPRAAALPR